MIVSKGMEDPSVCRARAAEQLALAKESNLPQERRQLEQSAQRWLHMAEMAEQAAARSEERDAAIRERSIQQKQWKAAAKQEGNDGVPA